MNQNKSLVVHQSGCRHNGMLFIMDISLQVNKGFKSEINNKEKGNH